MQSDSLACVRCADSLVIADVARRTCERGQAMGEPSSAAGTVDPTCATCAKDWLNKGAVFYYNTGI